MRMGLPVDAVDMARTVGMCSGRGALAALSGAAARRAGSPSFWLTVTCSRWGRCRLHAGMRITDTSSLSHAPSTGEVITKSPACNTLKADCYVQISLICCITYFTLCEDLRPHSQKLVWCVPAAYQARPCAACRREALL